MKSCKPPRPTNTFKRIAFTVKEGPPHHYQNASIQDRQIKPSGNLDGIYINYQMAQKNSRTLNIHFEFECTTVLRLTDFSKKLLGLIKGQFF